MGIAKDTKFIIGLISAITVICFSLAILFWILYDVIWQFILLGLVIIAYVFLIWTFRDPERKIKVNSSQILAPADGRIIDIEERENGIYIVIRMSPFDVHMTRSPISGEVRETEFKKGAHWPAYFPEYTKKNQRNRIDIVNSEQEVKVIVTQVSGIFARRTIAYIKEGDKVTQGEVIGTIRFGSITSVEVISDKKYKIKYKLSNVVRAGLSVLAECD
jgi:phosphatidylserine decarboxylase